MTLSNKRIVNLLNKNFVCGHKNIAGESYAGTSNDHSPDMPAVTTTNGAGSRNIQFIVISPKGSVLHCLPGYWGPKALERELKFALELNALEQKKGLEEPKRSERFVEAHLLHSLKHPKQQTRESALQEFDAHRESSKADSDFFREGCDIHNLKTVDQVVHERMAERPFLAWNDFDLPTFADIGLRHYDAHSDGCEHDQEKETPSTSKRAVRSTSTVNGKKVMANKRADRKQLARADRKQLRK